MGDAVFAYRHNSLGRYVKAAIVVAASAMGILASAVPASAQHGIFDTFFGRRSVGNAPTAFADPFSSLFGSRPAETPRAPDMASGAAYCVRLCDGRFFPIQRVGNVTPAQACSSFCPAAQTKIYNGSTIDNASSADGKRYTELSTAFAYREKIVPGCTCNGKDAFGLVNTPIEEDATLRAGDIVATNTGLMAYNGNGAPGPDKKQAANFTPISSYSGLSADLRRRLTETKIAPATDTPAKPVAASPAPPADTTASTRNTRNKRVQADR
jgi:uncharacterized protein DUF2865